MTQTNVNTGPPARVPILGHVPAFVRDPLAFFADCASHYGDWVEVRFGTRPFFIATHPDVIETVLVTRHRSFRKSPGLRRSSILFGEGLLTSEGDLWRSQRKLIQPAFHRERIASAAVTMLEMTQSHLARWETGRPFDLHADLMRLTADVAVKILFGSRIREIEAVSRAIEVGQSAFARWMHYLIMLPDWVPTPSSPAISRAVKELDRVIYGLIAERRAAGSDGNDLLSMLLKSKHNGDGRAMSERQLRDEILTLFLAGHETTALTLMWTLTLLAQNPAVEAKLHEELATAIGDRPVSPDDAARLTYTDQVVRESMRLYPPAWVIGRQAIEIVEIGGHLIAAGSPVIIPQYIVHRDSRYFPDPTRFQPERWTTEFANSLPRFAYFPFGGGPRICIGNSFAMLESVLLLASIASRFQLRLAPGHPVVLQPAFTLRPKGGLWMEATAL